MEKINLQALAERELTAYNDNKIAILRSFNEIKELPTEHILFEGFFLIMVTKGNAKILVDDKEYNLEVRDVFICDPRHILEKSMTSLDFEVISIIINTNYGDELMKKLNIDWNFRLMLQSHKIMHCQEKDMERLSILFKLLQDKLEAEDSPYRHNSIDMIICTIGNEVLDIQSRNMELGHSKSLSSGAFILQRFFNMLQNGKHPFLNVNGYADRLHVSAKYFSSLCKTATGKTAKQLINEEIIHTAQILLKDKSYNIQQIADDLGFANQSHFGVFFRRYTGISPQSYKNKTQLKSSKEE